ncbi:LysR family transcriptional regulator [Oharaeibacter diazotrophicus]|uniref:LysR family transcriptional regulator n=1 Tax=Oharaeibacter diazotrophicus TaxID=1920512 RepID=A0A4R6RF42_9HYPH|nr:LysR family transcriptional regulator [Oharaeibacter diazotrophicus]TDP84909.1 LysR family transcriptional regulator [Oharaeibacter diazotrophicus]BBE73880.1 HTH-type transcriptional regulator DmlR [Pleomorphomonas sp. SM30]GLS76435.1 LysR family transcriptional regulator [Oharaeibacter diazotrophicus]
MDTLTRMRTFVEVVDAGGFSAAARKLGRSKALISKYVKELEDELGARLMNRTTRRLSLTELGQAYYRDAGEILQRVDDLQDMVRERHGEPTGLLRVAAPRTFGDGPLGRGIMAFAAAYPAIKLDLRLDDRFVDLVDEGFDVAVRVTEMDDSSLIARKLSDYRFVVAVRPDVADASGRPAHPDELSDLPCIIDSNLKSRFTWKFTIDGVRHQVQVRGRVEVNSPAAVKLALLAGLGYGSVPYVMVQDDVAAGRLEVVLPDYESRAAGIYAVYPHRRHLSAKIRAFVDFLVEWFEKNGHDCRAGL